MECACVCVHVCIYDMYTLRSRNAKEKQQVTYGCGLGMEIETTKLYGAWRWKRTWV